MSKVELLAPAGNYACLEAAVCAGADAIYLGGEKFGARAFAGNFTKEELISGIQYAHLFGVRIFLTCNTLVKEKEFGELYEYIRPFYEAGLDGVIIQDFGVFSFLQKSFPGLELHASTQMTITGVHGAKLLKGYGATRIVPARELSLADVRAIREECDIEIECFIHGAMCYCYSGQCLFSSMLGGRSGNRGRCAQPCRLPYQASIAKQTKEDVYPLSLKDMCTIEHIGELIEAGITSFKIEGRMKSAEYVYGVTSIYRKYIDLYEKTGVQPSINAKDLKILNSLYIRSERHDGYYFKHNGKNMVSLQSPAYASCDEWILNEIKDRIITKKYPVIGEFEAKIGEPMVLKLTDSDQRVRSITYGAVVEQAMKRPMTEEDFEKQLRKTGDSWFDLVSLHMQVDDQIFVPIKEINELRRRAFAELLKHLTLENPNGTSRGTSLCESNGDGEDVTNDMQPEKLPSNVDVEDLETSQIQGASSGLQAMVTTLEQLKTVTQFEEIRDVIVDAELAVDLWYGDSLLPYLGQGKRFYLALPYIFRRRSESQFAIYEQMLREMPWQGVLVRNPDELGWLSEIAYDGEWKLDTSLYVWNREAKRFLLKHGNGKVTLTLPLELTKHEMRELNAQGMDMVIYGRLPLMVTANCIYKTNDACRPQTGYRELITLKDRKKKSLPVLANCTHCMNVILNATVLSLISFMDEIKKTQVDGLRLVFTTETREETRQILRGYVGAYDGSENEDTLYVKQMEHTNGHYKNGVD